MKLEEIYTAEWFAGHAALRGEYHQVADAIWGALGKPFYFKALDVGCGAAFILERLEMLGGDVWGLDGSETCYTVAPPRLHDRIDVVNIVTEANKWSDGLPTINRRPANCAGSKSSPPYPLVICTEVAEHIPPEHADALVDFLVKVSSATLIFSAAPPGQGGHDHVNEQPMQYWLDKFRPKGLTVDTNTTFDLLTRLQGLEAMVWFKKNIVVLRRA
jgi:hypothetical protein